MKKAFTLAEVLITLAVIGVVAALTIPTLVQKYQKKQMYTQFMKTYNAISSAMESAVAEHGEIDTWNWGTEQQDPETGHYFMVGGDNPAENYIYPQFKYISKCNNATDCFASGYSFLGNSGAGGGYYSTDIVSDIIEEYESAVVLPDGSVVAIRGNGFWAGIIFDTNGKKGPNVYGRDFFMADYNAEGDPNYVGPGMVSFTDYENSGSSDSNCNPSVSGEYNGDGCASRMIQEGGMNY